jgi:elongation factor P
MAQVTTTDLRAGMKVELDNDPYLIISNQFVKPGKGQAFNRVKIKNLMSGRVIEKTYKSGDKLDIADVVETKMRLLYTEQEDAIFMDDLTFEQTQVPLSSIGDSSLWLQEDILYEVIFFKEQIIDVIPPTFLELLITETEPGIKGDTASGRVLKAAKVETGAKVQVPIFVNEGEKIKVDTRTGDYVSRV